MRIPPLPLCRPFQDNNDEQEYEQESRRNACSGSRVTIRNERENPKKNLTCQIQPGNVIISKVTTRKLSSPTWCLRKALFLQIIPA